MSQTGATRFLDASITFFKVVGGRLSVSVMLSGDLTLSTESRFRLVRLGFWMPLITLHLHAKLQAQR